MKKYAALLILLSVLTTSCVTNRQKRDDIVLPPEPQRPELPQVTGLKDAAEVIIEYEKLVEEWELWSKTVKQMISPEE